MLKLIFLRTLADYGRKRKSPDPTFPRLKQLVLRRAGQLHQSRQRRDLHSHWAEQVFAVTHPASHARWRRRKSSSALFSSSFQRETDF